MIQDTQNNINSNKMVPPSSQTKNLIIGSETGKLSQATLQNEINKQVLVFLSKIQIGDTLKGQLIEEQGQSFLKLPNGMKLSAECIQSMNSRGLLDFIVVGKSRQHLALELKVNGLDSDASIRTLIEQATHELGLGESKAVQTVIRQFIAKQLPLMKTQLTQVLRYAQNGTLPTEALTNLVAKSQHLQGNELSLLSQYKGQEAQKVSELLKGVLDSVVSSQSRPMAHLVHEQFQPVAITAALAKMFDERLQMYLNEQEGLEAAKPATLELSPLKQEAHGQEWATGLQDNSDFFKMLNEQPDKLLGCLEKMPIHVLKEVVVETFKQELTLHVSDQTVSDCEKLSEGGQLIKKLAQGIHDAGLLGTDGTKLQQLEQLGEIIYKYQSEAQYFCFPLQVHGQEAEGELYFFKPKKNKKHNQQGTYMVLALNLPHLHKIEIHVQENHAHVNISLKVQNEGIKKIIEQHEAELRTLFDETTFSANSITCEVLGNKKSELPLAMYDALSGLDARI